MMNFCTLFDSHYLSRGIAMYESLSASCPDFRLYIFAFDDVCYEYLAQKNLPNVILISLKEFEDEELLAVKADRSKGEYCWTCTPSTVLYCLKKYNLPLCTYIDADLYFYSNPEVLLEEMGDSSILITEHRYTPEYDQSKTSGIYCVQFIAFKNDHYGLEALTWWRNACLAWCYARYEDGKFGDQKYLDDWTDRFKKVHVLKHLGGGIAPWNVQQYQFSLSDGRISGVEINHNEKFSAIFYHFHNLKFFPGDKIELGGYFLSPAVKEFFYKPYISYLLKVENKINSNMEFAGKINSISPVNNDWKMPLRRIMQKIKKSYNRYDVKQFMETKWLK